MSGAIKERHDLGRREHPNRCRKSKRAARREPCAGTDEHGDAARIGSDAPARDVLFARSPVGEPDGLSARGGILELKFDGRDDEFYNLKAGDDVTILVSDADPSRIHKA